MNVPKFIRQTTELRTLESLGQQLQKYKENGNNPKNAKNCFNVIDDVHFDIPLEQVNFNYYHR